MILIGYSGHAFVAYGIFKAAGIKITGYCDVAEKEYNPFNLTYFGTENSETGFNAIKEQGYFISVGDNLHKNFPSTTQLFIFKKAKHDVHFRFSKQLNKKIINFLK